MDHRLDVITNGDWPTREAKVRCTCGIGIILAGVYELHGDVTETANEAIANHAALNGNLNAAHATLDNREVW